MKLQSVYKDPRIPLNLNFRFFEIHAQKCLDIIRLS
jgi:hypothetical protein